MAKIEIRDISHAYQELSDSHMILDGISLEINEGDSIGIMGASGSGKSTLLHIISGLLKPNLGVVLYDGKSLNDMSSRESSTFRSEKMGFMFQNQHFFPELSVIDNVSLPLRIVSNPKALEEAKTLLAMMQIDTALYDRYPHELSGGEQARCGLARALLAKPKVLVADEPTSALDDALTQAIFSDIKRLQKELGFSMIVATHDTTLVPHFDVIYTLHNGKICDDRVVASM